MDGLVQHDSLLRGYLKGSEERLRNVIASVRLTSSYRTGGSKREKAAGDLDANLARDRCDMCVKRRGERHCTIDHRNGRRVWVTGQGQQNISNSHRTLRRNVKGNASFYLAGRFDLSQFAGD